MKPIKKNKPTIIETEHFGPLSYTRFNKMVREAGSQAAFARANGLPTSTVRTWKQRLNQKRNQLV